MDIQSKHVKTWSDQPNHKTVLTKDEDYGGGKIY